ncbi:Imm8 family immunity protein [Flavobacterium sp. UBA4854]|uniref:Imm8 family immunity protein n=1 Tax=Flavobacterium sp. UBA4854 TaxID=1946548 RepID=UPI00257B8FE7|nr:Imm8 family immunity protein [Flavobacterium sp. UBA4854]
MIKLALYSACVGDFINLRKWQPENEEVISELINLEIGIKNKKGSDGFTFTLVTPQGFQLLLREKGIIATRRPLLIVERYNFDHIWNSLEEIIASCQDDSWSLCVEKLKKYFDWEYDNYKEK